MMRCRRARVRLDDCADLYRIPASSSCGASSSEHDVDDRRFVYTAYSRIKNQHISYFGIRSYSRPCTNAVFKRSAKKGASLASADRKTTAWATRSRLRK
jgi:hypothetical protein